MFQLYYFHLNLFCNLSIDKTTPFPFPLPAGLTKLKYSPHNKISNKKLLGRHIVKRLSALFCVRTICLVVNTKKNTFSPSANRSSVVILLGRGKKKEKKKTLELEQSVNTGLGKNKTNHWPGHRQRFQHCDWSMIKYLHFCDHRAAWEVHVNVCSGLI